MKRKKAKRSSAKTGVRRKTDPLTRLRATMRTPEGVAWLNRHKERARRAAKAAPVGWYRPVSHLATNSEPHGSPAPAPSRFSTTKRRALIRRALAKHEDVMRSLAEWDREHPAGAAVTGKVRHKATKTKPRKNPAASAAPQRSESARERRARSMRRLRAWLADPKAQARAARERERIYRLGGFPP